MQRRRWIFRELCLSGALAVGFGLVWGLLIGWGGTVWNEWNPRTYRYENLLIQADGTPVIQMETYLGGSWQNRTSRTLDGKQITPTESETWLTGASLPATKAPETISLNQSGWSRRIAAFTDGRRPATFWYFIHRDQRQGTGYFMGFDSQTKLPVGFIGRTGYRAEIPPVDEHFAIDGLKHAYRGVIVGFGYRSEGVQPDAYGPPVETSSMPPWLVYLLSEDRLLEIDLHHHSVRTVMESAGMLSIQKFHRALKPSVDHDSKKSSRLWLQLAVRREDQILIYDPNSSKTRSYKLPAEIRDEHITFYEVGDGMALVTDHKRNRRGGKVLLSQSLTWFNDSGEVIRREDNAIQSIYYDMDLRTISFVIAAIVPAPIVAAPLITINGSFTNITNIAEGEETDYMAALARAFFEGWPGVLATFVMAAGLAWICYRRQRQFALPGTTAWVMFVFLFGLPGLMGYLLHRRWPVREACPDCGDRVARDRESCSACSSDFPLPVTKGTEVFA